MPGSLRVVALLAAPAFLPGETVPRFEVATLKLSPPPQGDSININLGTFRNGRLTLNNVTLSDAIKFAYELVSDDQLSVPDWNPPVRFDIEALAPPTTSPEQLHLMTQALLAERLHLVLHREQRTLRYLALLPAPSGIKLQPARLPATPPGIQVRGRIAHLQMPMRLLASLLSRFERQTIVDFTALPGAYEVKLEWAPDTALAPDHANAPPPDRPSLFTAVQEQLGLKLESRRGPLPVLVVTEASKVPEGN